MTLKHQLWNYTQQILHVGEVKKRGKDITVRQKYME